MVTANSAVMVAASQAVNRRGARLPGLSRRVVAATDSQSVVGEVNSAASWMRTGQTMSDSVARVAWAAPMIVTTVGAMTSSRPADRCMWWTISDVHGAVVAAGTGGRLRNWRRMAASRNAPADNADPAMSGPWCGMAATPIQARAPVAPSRTMVAHTIGPVQRSWMSRPCWYRRMATPHALGARPTRNADTAALVAVSRSNTDRTAVEPGGSASAAITRVPRAPTAAVYHRSRRSSHRPRSVATSAANASAGVFTTTRIDLPTPIAASARPASDDRAAAAATTGISTTSMEAPNTVGSHSRTSAGTPGPRSLTTGLGLGAGLDMGLGLVMVPSHRGRL